MISEGCKVSIITVVYNGVATIEQTIQSVLNQTYKNIEYIIIDGLSTDGTQQIIEKYRQFIAYYVSEKDDGLYDAMNKGIQQATGEVIGILNSDDWYDNYAVEKAVDYLAEYDVGIVYGRLMLVYPDGSQRLEKLLPLETLWYQTSVSHPTVFVKKSIYEYFGSFRVEYKIAADYELLLRLYCEEVEFGFIDSVLTYFRVGGISAQKSEQSYQESLAISRIYIEKYSKRKDELLNRLENAKKTDYFYCIIKKNKKLLSRLLQTYFHKELSEIMIFGTGVWGTICYELLKDSKIKIKFFIDNDLSKKDQLFHGIKIIMPQELLRVKAFILIAVKNREDDIKDQLKRLENSNIKYVGLNDLINVFYRNDVIYEGKIENVY